MGGDESEIDLEWCAAFVMWCHRYASPRVAIPGNFWRNRAVHALQRSLEDAGMRADYPEPGDLFVLSRARHDDRREILLDPGEPGHVGFIRRHTPTGFWSVEGNVYDQVQSRFWHLPSPRIRAYYAPTRQGVG